MRYSNDQNENSRESNEVAAENHGTLPNSTYNTSAALYVNNNGSSPTQDGTFQSTETTRLITSEQGMLCLVSLYKIS